MGAAAADGSRNNATFLTATKRAVWERVYHLRLLRYHDSPAHTQKNSISLAQALFRARMLLYFNRMSTMTVWIVAVAMLTDNYEDRRPMNRNIILHHVT